MKTFVLIAFLSCLCLGALSDSITGPGCGVSVTTTPRAGGSYLSGSGVSQIYDIAVTNNGKCNADLIGISIATPSGSSITQTWNLEAGSLYYSVTGYQSTLPVGSLVNAGLIVNFPGLQSPPAGAVSTTVYGTACPAACVNAQATTSSASTSATSASTATTATTSSVPPATTTAASTTSSSGSSSSGCKATSTVTARSGGSFQSGSGMSQIYDVVVLNSGSCPLTNINLNLALPAGASVSSTWNLAATQNALQYTVTNYEGLLPVGNSVNVGFVVLFPNTQTIPASAVSTLATNTACPATCPAASSSASSSSSSTGSSTAATTASSSSSTTGTTGTPATTTSTSASGSGSCKVSVTTTARAGATYQVGSGMSQIYDVVALNSGSCALNNIVLSLALPTGATITSSWNLQADASNSHYTITSYQGTLPAGNSVNAGFIVNFPGVQTVPAGVAAASFATTCNTCSA